MIQTSACFLSSVYPLRKSHNDSEDSVILLFSVILRTLLLHSMGFVCPINMCRVWLVSVTGDAK